MAPRHTFKICRCCRTKASLRKRVCKRCGVPAIWDRPSQAEQASHDADIARRQQFIERLMAESEA